MNNKYALNPQSDADAALAGQQTSVTSAALKFKPLLVSEKMQLFYAAIAIVVNSVMNLWAPIVVGQTIDRYIQTKDMHGVLVNTGWLFLMYAVALVASYAQTRIMGGVGQRVLFQLRNSVFEKLQSLPVAFFQQNKAGDLISRINNDTDKLGQFFSQSLMQFLGNIFIIIGAGISIVLLDFRLGLAALAPAFVIFVLTKLLGPWIKRKNAVSLKSLGGMSAEIQESLNNFKVVIAFNRRDFFRTSFQEANEENYKAAVRAGIANNTFTPIYTLASNAALMIVILYGVHLIITGHITIGLMISFITYVTRLYDPLRQMAALWTTFQVALAGWDRIHAILQLDSDLEVVASDGVVENPTAPVMQFDNVGFGYSDDAQVLSNISFALEHGKTYALVGPTGGGKTTTASLMARLYDPSAGTVLMNGKDLRTYTSEERAQKIGFILQEPFLFSGTVGENICYNNPQLSDLADDVLLVELEKRGLNEVISKFNEGLATKVEATGDTMSLGQKQLIAFARAILRDPELLILDEATANIDTVTEQLLEDILRKLPASTTRVVIAHRLNTIADADTIFFVNGGEITEAGSMEQAVDMLLHGQRKS